MSAFRIDRYAPQAVVIGAGVHGLIAACYLARAGWRVTVLEKSGQAGGLVGTLTLANVFRAPRAPHALYALDPQMVKDLRLSRTLKLAARDMTLIGLRADGAHLVLPRGHHHAAEHMLDHVGVRDAQSYAEMRRQALSLARALRRWWWRDAQGDPRKVLGRRDAARLSRLEHQSASAWLNFHFESEKLKAALAFDAIAGGLSPLEPGSALTLFWRWAQESGGLQGAASFPRGGMQALARTLEETVRAAGAEIRFGVAATRIAVAEGRVVGVELSDDGAIETGTILSSLSLAESFALTAPGTRGFGAPAPAAPMTGDAKILLALDQAPVFAGNAVPLSGRMILNEGVAGLAAAHTAARAGRLPDDIIGEIVFPAAADPALAPPLGQIVSMLLRPMPVAPVQGWDVLAPQLLARVLASLERLAPGIGARIIAHEVLTPRDWPALAPVGAAHILAPAAARIGTMLDGLFLCGASAEPVPALSGCAARLAAGFARRHKEDK